MNCGLEDKKKRTEKHSKAIKTNEDVGIGGVLYHNTPIKKGKFKLVSFSIFAKFAPCKTVQYGIPH